MKSKLYQILILLAVVTCSCSKQESIKNIEVAGVKNPEILLNGIWKFSMTPPDKFWENSVDFQNWSDIQVPGECQMQGFAIKHDQPYAYKHKFAVPQDYEGKQIQLNFYGVYSYARVWVNGQFVREHFGGFTKWSCNITQFVTAGEVADLTVEIVDRADDISHGSGYAKHQIGGILRDVKLAALPKQNFEQLYFETDFDDKYIDSELKVFYSLKQNTPSKIKIELLDSGNKVIKSLEKETNSQKGKLTIPVVSPKKWDAEHPNLYTVIATLYEDGKKIMVKSERIGFRKVVREGNKLLVNGKSVKLRGACRHNIHPLLGRMTTPEYDKMDVLLAKESNMNFIRTSHYPPSEAFLDYCDEYGIYVEDETAVCFVRSSQSKPEFTERFLSQLEEMVQNHRNRPSIIIWSIGNENRFGDNFVKSFDWLKAEDVTRPIIYSYPGQVPDSLYVYDIISMHYPSWKGDREQFGLNIKGFSHESMPVLFDEWAHVACYNNFELKEDPNVRNFWGQSLDSMWTNLFETEGGLGGAIWCMLDETFMLPEDLEGFDEWWGIISSGIIPSIYEGHCVGFGEWGIVDTWRRKKPEFWGTKKAYSPTKIYTKQIDDFQKGKELQIPIHNRFDHTNFSELKIVWEYGTKSGELENVNIEPHSKGVLVFPANNWNSSEKFNIKFFQDDSFLVDEYNIQLGKREVDLPICKSGNLTVKKEKDIITVSGKEFTLNVNMKTGLLENVQRNGETIIESGPFINFKLPGKAILHSTIEMDDYAKNWKLTNFNFVENNGIATINSKGTYDSISASFTIKVDETGVFNIDYNIEGAPKGKNIQEVGIKFQVGDAFKTLAWDRNSYFTAYPQSDLGSPIGRVDIPQRTEMNYRKKPNHGWELDMKGFYYFGLDKELPYTNIVRALKENIYTYSLITQSGSKLEVISDGVNACRFDKIEGDNTLIINSQWDYSNLLWGNYMKQIKSGGEFGGQVKFLTR